MQPVKILGIIPAGAHRVVPFRREGLLVAMFLLGFFGAGCTTMSKQSGASITAEQSELRAYREEIVSAIDSRWRELLENQSAARVEEGKVVVTFKLHYTGRISKIKVTEATVPEALRDECMDAVMKAAPFRRWPAAVRRAVGGDTWSARLTFYFGQPPSDTTLSL